MNLHEEKSALRRQLSRKRDELIAADRKQKNQQIHKNLSQIAELKQVESVFCYISYLTEVHTHVLIKQWLAASVQVAVPKIIDKTTMHAVSLSCWDELEPDKFGILTPKSNNIATGPFEVSITPGLGFTQSGARLGYGRGYYDRWFARHEVMQKIGVCYETQIMSTLPTEETDVVLDMLVTEQTVYRF